MKKKIIYFLEKFIIRLINRPNVSKYINNNFIDSGLNKLKSFKNIDLGNDIFIGKNTSFYLDDKLGSIKLGDNFSCRNFCNFLVYPGASLSIGNNVFFNNYCSINCLYDISIGDNTMLGEGVKLYDHNHKYEYVVKTLKVDKDLFTYGKISIGSNCWIGSNVTILKGVTIGDNVIIGAGCVIYKSIPSNSIVKHNGELLVEKMMIKNYE